MLDSSLKTKLWHQILSKLDALMDGVSMYGHCVSTLIHHPSGHVFEWKELQFQVEKCVSVLAPRDKRVKSQKPPKGL